MQRKKCFLIVAVLSLLIGFLASFQPTKASPSVSASSVYPPPPVEWNKTYAFISNAYSLWQTDDEGYVLGGVGTQGGCLVKTDNFGSLLWNKTYGYNVQVHAVQQTTDRGYVLIGRLAAEAWLCKTNEVGDMLMNKTYGGEGIALAFSGQQTDDGGYVLAGGTYPAGGHGYDFYLVKTDAFGNLEWNKTYGGETPDEVVRSLQQTSDGGYILAGEMSSLGVFSASWLVKTDASGNMEWNKTYGANNFSVAYSVRQTTDGGYVLVGVSRDENHQKYAYVFRLNSIGEIEWENAYHVPQVWSEAYSVAVTNDNGYIVAGDYSNEESTVSKHAWLLRIDSSGGSLWNGTYGETAQAWAVIQAADGGYVVAGSGLTKIFADRQLVARFQYNPDNPIIQETIIFNATSSYDPNQDIVSYSWDFDDGNVSSVTSPVISHRYDHSGIYNVSLMVVDAEGFNSSYSRLVNIPAGPPVARFEYSPHSPVFQETILFNASSSYDRNQDIISYLWNFDDGNITSTMNPIVVHWYENPGIYNVSLRVGDAEGFNSSYSIVVCAKNPTSLSISTSSPSAAAGYSVNITVTLLDSADMSLKNETVDLFYTFTGIENWTPISSNCTDSLGNYYANWSPPMASYFTIKAVYAGNYTHVESSRKVTVSMLPYGEMYLFSVESNSTVSSMGFDTNNQTLSFTATGEMGTVGYAKVTAAKSLVPDLALLSVHVDDAEYNYTVTDADDSWVLLFAYDHSVHLVEIQLDSTIPEFPSFLIITLFVIATLLAAIVQNIKHGFLQKRLNPLRE